DLRDLGFEPDQDRGDRLGEMPAALVEAPSLETERLRQHLAVDLRIGDGSATHAAMLGEVEQELGMLDRGVAGLAGDTLLLAHVLGQELAHLLVRAIAKDEAD